MWLPTTAITEIFLLALQFASITQARPTNVPDNDDSSVIAGEYIVVLKDLTDNEFTKHISWVSDLGQNSREEPAPLIEKYSIDNLRAYHGSFDRKTIRMIASSSEVLFIEPNRVVNTPADIPTSLDRRALVTQTPAAASLARISHRKPGSTSYVYDSSAGSGTWVYLLSTGINVGHTDFGGRATHGYNGVSGSSNDDGNGSGTAVAGVISGIISGVAKRVNIISVKVLDSNGSGTVAGIIAGIQWTVNDILTKGRVGHAVICLPLGGSPSAAMNNAVNSASAQGVPVIVPAGSSNADAANTSPASAVAAIVIGALGLTDTRASFSNYGSAIDYFAPAMSITTTWIPGNAFNTLSGTSFSTGIAAGLAAYLQGLENLPTVEALSARLTELSTVDAITGLPANTVNRILYNGSGS
ncbi:hypothetical protein Q9L58_001858 [Maublancomyces gigas]|uniref:Uncharacterized protein n=1 Tax=Discina gigas TaxID=1032678 RepID=A0ABR3GTC4_9PEZI